MVWICGMIEQGDALNDTGLDRTGIVNPSGSFPEHFRFVHATFGISYLPLAIVDANAFRHAHSDQSKWRLSEGHWSTLWLQQHVQEQKPFVVRQCPHRNDASFDDEEVVRSEPFVYR